MKINKDVLNALRVETVYILCGGGLCLCAPLEIKGNRWCVSCDTDNIRGKVVLKVKFNGSFIYLDSEISRKNQDTYFSFIYELEISGDEKKKDSFKLAFFRKLEQMEMRAAEWDKRREERYEIGFDEKRIKALRLKTAEQILVTDKVQLPCLINNISYSGAKVTTLSGNFQKDKKVCLFLSFVSPIEQIPLIGIIKNCLIKSTDEKKLVAVLSLKFEDPSIDYKTRLDSFIRQTGESR